MKERHKRVSKDISMNFNFNGSDCKLKSTDSFDILKSDQDFSDDFEIISHPILGKTLMKPIHVKPAFYTFVYGELKEIATKFGYNLVLHGSLSRDLDLIAIPWSIKLGDVDTMIQEFSDLIGGQIMIQSEEQKHCFPHGRLSYVININRTHSNITGELKSSDQQWYLDISVIQPHNNK
jgi:hypothetical protein